MEKRGFAISFKWIFAIIAGFIIFLFLINFAYKHIYLSETKTSTILLSNIEAQLDSISFVENMNTIIDIGEEIELNLNCNSLAHKEIKTNTEKIIFSPNKIRSNKFNVWTRTWKYPFPITNFYYITNNNYYFFNEPYDLISKIPEIFNIKTYPDTVSNDAILIFFREPTQSELQQYKDHKIKIILNNQVTFYPYKSESYYGDEMLLGAIFTDDIIKYECLKNKALNKLKIIATVHQKKAETLRTLGCQNNYQLIINLLEQFKTNPINPEAIQNLDEDIQKNGCTPLSN